MQRYYHREGTPLAFHNFIRFFSIPVGLMVLIKRLFWDIVPYMHLHPLYLLDFSYTAIALALFIISLIGFCRWKSYAWHSWMTYLTIAPIYNLALVVIYAMYLPGEMLTVVVQAITTILYAILVSVYYRKRKPLFFPSVENVAADASDQFPYAEAQSGSAEKPDPTNVQAFCPQCHAELSSAGSKYCPSCGHKIWKDEDASQGT